MSSINTLLSVPVIALSSVAFVWLAILLKIGLFSDKRTDHTYTNFTTTLGTIAIVILASIRQSGYTWESTQIIVTLEDNIGLILFWIVNFIALLCCLYVYSTVSFNGDMTQLLLVSTTALLSGAFLSTNLLEFYVLFEATLIPMVTLILANGSRGRKIHATILFFFYTLFSSIPLLFGIVFVYILTGTLEFDEFWGVSTVQLPLIHQILILVLFGLGFAAKIPVVPLHLWLPEAHVEAPTIGSVILAALVLKLGTFGLFKVIIPLCQFESFEVLRPALATTLLLSVIYSALSAVRQTDIKKIIAYSSVSHMNFSLFGLITCDINSLNGFLLLMVTHSLISANMFFLVGMLYDRFHTRNILYYGGLVQYMPLFSIFYFITMISNTSMPGTCNFISELLVLYGIGQHNSVLTLILVNVGLLFTTLFCFVLIYRILFLQITGLLTTNLVDLTIYEFSILICPTFYIFFLGLNPNLLLELLI